ncbi:MAG: S8 family serine peptidase [Culturomica sp.]|jgi:subtilisin family serine protease|nr:S8 family serine peptidase [Culturomica sp.]
MKRFLYFPALLVGLSVGLAACQKDDIRLDEEPSVAQLPEEHPLEKGHVRVKFTEEAVRKLNVIQTRSGLSTGLTTLDEIMADNRVYRMEPVFQVGGKFEARQRKAGLHLWYDVYFDEGIPTRSMAGTFDGQMEIEYVETIPEVRLQSHVSYPNFHRLLPLFQPLLLTRGGAQPTADEALPFNDPRLQEQWHYHNAGEAGTYNHLTGAIAGADIDLFRAWKIETGSPEVIVAIVDGGIQYDHPDLWDNMWINEAERNGTAGVDDDNNGYIDDVYGVNFVTRTNTGNGWGNVAITQHSHGTHVAGTVAAVNGNGTGVCGIAGGSGEGDGVRLMSCQMFHMNNGAEQSRSTPDMYRYAADNGAVIAQNSWTSGRLSDEQFLNSANRVGIDYFIDNAGMDANGNQTGPMKGGVVIFATANQDSDIKEYPAAYERNFRVSAMAHNFRKSTYSNYGAWTDITAPGGEQRNGNVYAILSTDINNGYGWKQGTSMACPHVSGCAALLLSKYQGPDYTPDQLIGRLVNTAGNIDQYNPDYAGLLGKGYIRIGEALTPPSLNPPAVTELQLIAAYDSWAIVEWTVGRAEDGNLSSYELYWGQESITEDNLLSMSSRSYDVKFRQPGTVIRDTVTALTLNDTYHFTLRNSDRWGQHSGLAEERVATIEKNNAPVLQAQWDGELIFSEGSTQILSVSFSDAENHAVTATLDSGTSWDTVRIIIREGLLELPLPMRYGAAGRYDCTLTVQDEYGAASTLPFRIEIQHRSVAPALTVRIPDVVLHTGAGAHTVELDKYFTDPAGRKLVYELDWDERYAHIAFVQRRDNRLLITPQGNGTIYVTVRAMNPDGMEASAGFSVTVNNVTEKWDVSQTGNKVSIYLAPALQGTVALRLYNVAGREVKSISASVGNTGYVLDLSDLSAGVYTLVLKAGSEELRKNLIKK